MEYHSNGRTHAFSPTTCRLTGNRKPHLFIKIRPTLKNDPHSYSITFTATTIPPHRQQTNATRIHLQNNTPFNGDNIRIISAASQMRPEERGGRHTFGEGLGGRFAAGAPSAPPHDSPESVKLARHPPRQTPLPRHMDILLTGPCPTENTSTAPAPCSAWAPPEHCRRPTAGHPANQRLRHHRCYSILAGYSPRGHLEPSTIDSDAPYGSILAATSPLRLPPRPPRLPYPRAMRRTAGLFRVPCAPALAQPSPRTPRLFL